MADPQWSSPSASWAISSIATATARMTAIVFARGDFDAVCVAQRQPVLRYAGDRIVSTAELVLVVQDAPLGDDILVPLHVDRELVAERREPRLADRSDGGGRFSGARVRVPEPSTQATLPPASSPQISGK